MIGWEKKISADPSKKVSQRSIFTTILFKISLHKLNSKIVKITEEYRKSQKKRLVIDVENVKSEGGIIEKLV